MLLLAALIATWFVAFIVGQVVTERLVRSGGWWARPITSRFVRANIPVGGALVAAVMLATPPPYQVFVGMVALGFTLSAIGYDA